jgi:cysteinyl-tRNA synthetase
MVLRFFLLRQHYSSPVDFSDDKLEEAKKSLNGIFELSNQDVKAASPGKQTGNDNGFLEMINNTEKEFQLAMDDDFNTAGAIGSIFKLIRELNIRISNKQPIAQGILKIKQLFNEVLGINFESFSEELSDALKIILSQREEARKNKDWKKSDEIRNKLTQMGYTVDDTPQGSRLKKI